MPITPVTDLYLVWVHEPYESPDFRHDIDATLVHADALRHPIVPQPHGVNMYRCLTEAPGRLPGQVVALSDLTHELDGGRLWQQVADWETVIAVLTRLVRRRDIDAMPLSLGLGFQALLAAGPATETRFYEQGTGLPMQFPVTRNELLDQFARYAQAARTAGNGRAFSCGNALVTVPRTPDRMPYQPHRSGGAA